MIGSDFGSRPSRKPGSGSQLMNLLPHIFVKSRILAQDNSRFDKQFLYRQEELLFWVEISVNAIFYFFFFFVEMYVLS